MSASLVGRVVNDAGAELFGGKNKKNGASWEQLEYQRALCLPGIYHESGRFATTIGTVV